MSWYIEYERDGKRVVEFFNNPVEAGVRLKEVEKK